MPLDHGALDQPQRIPVDGTGHHGFHHGSVVTGEPIFLDPHLAARHRETHDVGRRSCGTVGSLPSQHRDLGREHRDRRHHRFDVAQRAGEVSGINELNDVAIGHTPR